MLAAAAALALAGGAMAAAGGNKDDDAPGAVYAITNSPAGNAVVVFRRAGDGSLGAASSFAAGGTGTGAASARRAP